MYGMMGCIICVSYGVRHGGISSLSEGITMRKSIFAFDINKAVVRQRLHLGHRSPYNERRVYVVLPDLTSENTAVNLGTGNDASASRTAEVLGMRASYMRFCVIGAIVLISLTFCAFIDYPITAQTPSLATPIPSVPPTPLPIPTPTVDPQVRILQAQLEQMQKDSSRDVAIVAWGFTTLVVLTLVLLGVNWFASRREKSVFRDQIQKTVDNQVSKLRTGFEREANNQYARIEKSLEEANRREIERLQHSFLSLKLDILEAQALEWTRQGVMNNVIRTDIDKVNTAVEIDWSHEIERSLQRIQTSLRATFFLSSDLVTDLDNVLKKLSDSFPSEVKYTQELIIETKNRIARLEQIKLKPRIIAPKDTIGGNLPGADYPLQKPKLPMAPD